MSRGMKLLGQRLCWTPLVNDAIRQTAAVQPPPPKIGCKVPRPETQGPTPRLTEVLQYYRKHKQPIGGPSVPHFTTSGG